MRRPRRRLSLRRLRRHGERPPLRDRTRRGLAMLPSLLTLGNLVCGFYAIIHVGTVEWVEGVPQPGDAFQLAALALLVAMVFDMLDGRVARMTRTTSDFGAQLDSLADVVTFGVAPGVIVAMLHAMGRYDFQAPFWSKMAWVFGAVYTCGAAVRLARFNVETESHDEDAHRYFKGLPSPAAAGVVATLVLLNHFLMSDRADLRLKWLEPNTVEWVGLLILDLMPFVALGLGYLMVSTFKYVHAANYFLRGRQPFEYLAAAIFLAAFGALFPEVSAALIFCGFAISGPLMALIQRNRAKPAEPDAVGLESQHPMQPLSPSAPTPTPQAEPETQAQPETTTEPETKTEATADEAKTATDDAEVGAPSEDGETQG